MSNKVTRKQIRANEALEKRKYQRRLSKANPNVQITSDVVNEQISISHVDRIQNMLPPGIKVHGMFNLPKRKRIDPRSILPYKSLKKFVHWLPVNQQDAGSTVTLTKEIEEFAKYVALDQSEIYSRENMLRELHETIMSKWSTAVINQFGSYAVGLSTFMSDLDISIMNMGVDNDTESPNSTALVQKPNNHIIQTQVFGSGSGGLAQLQANTLRGTKTLIEIDDSDNQPEVVDLTSVDLIKATAASKRKRDHQESEDDENGAEETISDTDSDYKNSKYNQTSFSSSAVALKRAKEASDAAMSYAQKVVDLVSSSSDSNSSSGSESDHDSESGSENDDEDEEAEDGEELNWKIDTKPDFAGATKSKAGASSEEAASHSEASEEQEEEEQPDNDDSYEDSSSDDSRDSRYESLEDGDDVINEDSMTEADLAELNRLYEAEERALADIDDDDNDNDGDLRVVNGLDIGSINDDSSASVDSSSDEVVQLAQQKNPHKRRRRDSGDDDSYYSEGDIYNRHRQNELFRSIKSKIERSNSDMAGGDGDVSTATATAADEELNGDDSGSDESGEKNAEEVEEDIEGASSDGNDSLTRLLLMNHSDSNDSESGDGSSEDEEEEEELDGDAEDDLEHSLIVGGAAAGSASSRMSFQSGSTTAVVDKEAELQRHRKQLTLLRAIFPHVRGMNWLARLELRSKARVPIINLQHKNSIECDISVGVSAQDTSHIVQELKQFCGPALLALSSFLKVFLSQLDLDKPFSGGLGSYKLYVIIAAHIERNQTMIADKLKPDLGSLLLSFFKFYGNPRNLNSTTTVRVLNAEVCFDRTNRVGELQKLFEVAHDVLSRIVEKRLLKSHLVSSSSSGGSSQALIIKPGGDAGNNKSNSTAQQLLSSSALAALLNVEDLCRLRAQYRNKCRDYPLIPEEDLVSMSQKIVNDLERRLAFPKGLTVDEIQRINPCLYARLRSFPSVEAAVKHLGARDSTFAPNQHHHFNSGGANGGAFPRTKSLPAFVGGGGGSSSKGFGRNSIPKDEFKFSHNGVVGNSIVDLTVNSRARRNKNSREHKSKGGQSGDKTARHSFGGFSQAPVLGKRSHQHQHHHQQPYEGEPKKHRGNTTEDQPVIIPSRYANTKSGFSFANGNYKASPNVASVVAAPAAPTAVTAASAAQKVKIAAAAHKLSDKIKSSITELKSNIQKTKNSIAGTNGRKTE